ncbi:MAG: S1C family serine protease [Thermoleophilia bacterium]
MSTPPLPPLEPRRRPEGLPPLAPRPERAEPLRPLGADATAPPSKGALPPLVTSPAGDPPPPPRGPRRPSTRRLGTVTAFAAAVVVAGAAGGVAGRLSDDSDTATTTTVSTTTVAPTPAGDDTSLAPLVAATAPSVVQVVSGSSQGSGVILEPSGLVVTNHHVVQGADQVTIVTSDDRRVQASVVTDDERQDLAILRPAGAVPQGATMAEEPDGGLEPGDRVFAIGSPFGLQNTVTAGVVSAVGRTNPDNGVPMIQIDAPINPGNSGGGLFDMSGRLVGIPTSILGPIRGNVGIGFAVPVSRVRTLVETTP